MNFFKLYIGDYQRDTGSLSLAEHGAYLLMLQTYYATETPLPNGKALYRLLRAQGKAEQTAIDSVAERFWTATENGLVNVRADEEIAKARKQAEANRDIAQQREERRRTTRQPHEPSTNRATNDEPSHSQKPDSNPKGASSAFLVGTRETEGARCDSEPRPEDPETLGPTKAELLAVVDAVRHAGFTDVSVGDPKLKALVAQGLGVDEARCAATVAAQQGKGWGWAIGRIVGQRADAAATTLPPPVAIRSPPWQPNERGNGSAVPDAAQTAAALAARVLSPADKAASNAARERMWRRRGSRPAT